MCRFVNLNANNKDESVSDDIFEFYLNLIWSNESSEKCNTNKNTIYGCNSHIDSIEAIDDIYKKGFRALKLKNNLDINEKNIKKLNEYRFVLDVSGVSDNEFKVIEQYSKLPIIAIGNSNTLHEHIDNIDYKRLREIKLLDGVIGINIQKELLSSDRSRESSFDSIFEQITYMLSVVGTNNIGIAVNFNSETILPWEMREIKDIRVLERWLEVYYGKRIKDKIMYRNMIRVLNRKTAL